MAVRNGGNGVAYWLRSKVFYIVVLFFFSIGALLGVAWATMRHACEQLAAEQTRTVAFFSILAETSKADGAVQSSTALRTYAREAAERQFPNC